MDLMALVSVVVPLKAQLCFFSPFIPQTVVEHPLRASLTLDIGDMAVNETEKVTALTELTFSA